MFKCFFNFIGTGKGGSSIWGKKFEDELVDEFKVGFSILKTSCL